MKFVETPVFTKRVNALLNDEEYRAMQAALFLRTEQGDLIRGCRGLRKMRWRSKQTGKRSGIRIIYYWAATPETIYMLFLYPKSERDNLTPAQLNQLSQLIMEELK